MRRAKTVAAIAAGALAASALTGVAIAASATADDDSATSQHDSGERARDHGGRPGPEGPGGPERGGEGRGGQGPGGHGPGQRGPGLGPEGGLLHGEVVVEASDGVYETKRMQRGEVTVVSATSITVVSEDGYSATYAIDADTESTRDREQGPAQVGDAVHVMASVDGSTVTAERIDAMSAEAVAEMEEHRAEMEDWLADRPDMEEHRADVNRPRR